MKLKSLTLAMAVAVATLAFPAWAADDAAEQALVARAFELRHKDADQAAAAIKSLISAEGSISIQPSKGALVITDHPENLARITKLLERYDVPARRFHLDLTLVSASRSGNPKPVPEDLREISRKLSGVFRFNSFDRLGGIIASGREGEAVVLDVDGTYRASFRFGSWDPVTDSVRIEEFRLDRVVGGTPSGEPLLKTTLNLRLGQTVVLGASRQPDSQRALMLVLAASEPK